MDTSTFAGLILVNQMCNSTGILAQGQFITKINHTRQDPSIIMDLPSGFNQENGTITSSFILAASRF